MLAGRAEDKQKLPGQFRDLVEIMAPRAIRDDLHYQRSLDMIDRLMAAGRLTAGQTLYLDTLVQLVQAFESERHAIDTSDLSGLDSLRHLMEENGMKASDLVRLLGVRPSTGARILKGELSLSVGQLRTLAAHFKVRPRLFMPAGRPARSGEWQVSLVKGGHRHVFRYRQGEEATVLDTLRALANDPDSGFDWFDAAVVSFKLVRRQERQIQRASVQVERTKSAG